VNRQRRVAALLVASTLLAAGGIGQAAAAHESGRGFDTCVAPSTGFMRSWLGSPFRVTNIYLTSAQLAPDCRQQPELTPQWVRTVRANGWALLPLYVGRQAPCRDDRSQSGFTAANARRGGRAAAGTAVDRMRALHLGKHKPVYLDVEPYETTKSRCAAAVVNFVEAWTKALHHRGYIAGIYAHANRGIEPIARSASPRPDDVWWALFNGDPSTSYPTLHGHWKGHRIHQYDAESTANASTYNDQGPLQIDRNTVNADVVGASSPGSSGTYRASTPYDTASQAFLALKERASPSTNAAVTNSYSYGDALDITCQTSGEKIYGDNVWDKLSNGGYVFDLYTTTTGGLGYTTGIPRC
jgi:hypothetical protein